MSLRPRVRGAVSTAILVVLAVLITIYVRQNGDDVTAAFRFAPANMALLSLASIVFIALNGLRIFLLTDIFGLSLLPLEWFGLSAVNSLLNYLPGQGGVLARGAYLKQLHGLPVALFVASVAGSLVITSLSYGLLGLLAVTMVYLTIDLLSWQLLLVFSLITAAALLAVSLPWSKGWRPPDWLPRSLQYMWDGWLIIRSSRRTVILLILIDVLTALTFALRLYLTFDMMPEPVSFWASLAVTPPALLSSIIALTPGGLGIREAVVGWGAAVIGSNAITGIQAATVERVISVFWLLIVVLFFALLMPRAARDMSRGRTQR